MRRTILICAVLILFSRPRAAGGDWGDPLLTLRVEYRQDALDFDDVEKSFFRESARLGFGRSSAGITHIHIRESKENRFTGHLLIRGVSPHFEAVVGNYQLNFGTGLLVGRKKSITPDIFTRRLVLSREGIFSPADNGNPLFSFRGGAVAFTGGISGISISASGFFSSRYRYVKQDSRHPGIAPAGIPSILARTEGDHGHTEPAEILDYGALLSIMIGERLTAQSYYIRTVMRRAGNRRLLWNGSDGGGDGEFHGYGFYLQYRDGYITLFAELCFPRIIRQNATGHESRDRGRGLACGLIFHHPAFILSFSGKGTTGNYYSPHASGKPRGERAWAVDLTLRPAPRLSIGCGAFLEKMTAPSGYESHLPSIRREAVSIRYGVPGKDTYPHGSPPWKPGKTVAWNAA
ncbi:MAG: hypothetical protein E4G96_09735 [Chrysiogenales bacterium]|nr:MAG: hypothetical protein E4G96_09735 [Chrysiogenales bacterium]